MRAVFDLSVLVGQGTVEYDHIYRMLRLTVSDEIDSVPVVPGWWKLNLCTQEIALSCHLSVRFVLCLLVSAWPMRGGYNHTTLCSKR